MLKAEKRQGKAPLISKYAAKFRGVENAGNKSENKNA